MKIALHDNGLHLRFAPLTLTRPLGNVRMGIMTNDERWMLANPQASITYITESYLTEKFQASELDDDTLVYNSAVILTKDLAQAIMQLTTGSILSKDGTWIAKKGMEQQNQLTYEGDLTILENRWDLYQDNGRVLVSDFQWITEGRQSHHLSTSNTIIGAANLIFLEEGASVEASILNTKEGPIYVGKDAEIMEGSVVRGPLALCEHAGLKLATKVYGPTTLGPHCKVGGEVNNVVFQAYSNKGHDGFLGNAYVGEWCNLGADTNSSNLKNDYGHVATYSYETKEIEKTQVQFMGICMGDHSKCGINTMFNTATVIGVSANIYGGGFPDKFIESFTWGEPGAFVPFRLDKAIQVAVAMMARRKVEFTAGDLAIFKQISQQ